MSLPLNPFQIRARRSRPPVTIRRPSVLNARLVISPGCSNRYANASARDVDDSGFAAGEERHSATVGATDHDEQLSPRPVRSSERARHSPIRHTYPMPLRTTTANSPTVVASAALADQARTRARRCVIRPAVEASRLPRRRTQASFPRKGNAPAGPDVAGDTPTAGRLHDASLSVVADERDMASVTRELDVRDLATRLVDLAHM